MKQFFSLALALVMVAALFTGCGCAANVSTEPHGMITEDATTGPAIVPTPTATHGPTRPTETTHATLPTVTGSDPTDESTLPNSGSNGGTGSMGGGNGDNGGSGSTGGGIGGSGGTNGDTGNNESSMPTDATTMPRNRNRNTTR